MTGRRVACIGAGTVGSAWAVVFARAGYEVAVWDSVPETLSEFALPRVAQIARTLAEEMSTGEDAETVIARIRAATSLADAVDGVEAVQESVREELSVKRAVFDEIGEAAPPDALLMSSTSALPGSQFLTEVPNPERALVAHPVNPPSHIPLVELCGTGVTEEATFERARQLFLSARMEPVVLRKEIEGFLLNRLQYTMVNEAMHLVGEGYCTAEDIDRVLTSGLALRWASIGPFMTAHLNAREGFRGFVDQLGPMMKTMGREARTDYDWGPDLAESVHESVARILPVDSIPEAQAWRDGRILATRRMQAADHMPGRKKADPD
ncbi:3-hydroxybutyryl-CoA dehydrogenase [Pseudooceanicola batsensis HTCC2597]|uniref:3-hydroxybutyryl-CoA dehydrogenase n=1 Tax=Pseudooceanicola batsensis (strain ATCC BAA-863 / DSM 15984 / KCTC 12145 / HTCC2597) TaxID=252305 RepID=A3U0C1_PSEBH|nr:3-hydroxyacyl-CoA dehydrogenase NAD-binding domain-containing protein [Pseudooceanicola batsensis]EAQ02212.1 3-hydroxybutyryl-CoA dehydrogenase [Pseudooceanicola batsensis HTCC2597]